MSVAGESIAVRVGMLPRRIAEGVSGLAWPALPAGRMIPLDDARRVSVPRCEGAVRVMPAPGCE